MNLLSLIVPPPHISHGGHYGPMPLGFKVIMMACVACMVLAIIVPVIMAVYNRIVKKMDWDNAIDSGVGPSIAFMILSVLIMCVGMMIGIFMS